MCTVVPHDVHSARHDDVNHLLEEIANVLSKSISFQTASAEACFSA